MYELLVEGSFDAAHQLRDYSGPCENLHGHTWKVRAYLEGKTLDRSGMLIDFRKLKKVLYDILEKFDHQCLNNLQVFETLSPTSENVARLIYDTMKVGLKGEKNLKMKKVSVFESEHTSATYWEK